ncbi:MAG: zinc ribbon domain-containing protein [Kiritimatiellia bacterium]
MMRCTKCGHTFWSCTGTHHYSKKKTRFYKDGGYQTHGKAVYLHTMIDADALDAWVLRQLRVVVLGDTDTAEQAIDAFVRDAMGGRDNGEDRAGVQKELAAAGKRIKATVGLLGNAELGGMAELEQALVDLRRQRKELEPRLAGCAAPASPAPSEKEVQEWAKEKIEKLDAAVSERWPPMELRRVVSGYVDRIEIDPVAKTGTMYLPVDALACLEADAIRRVNNGSPYNRNKSLLAPAHKNLQGTSRHGFLPRDLLVQRRDFMG